MSGSPRIPSSSALVRSSVNPDCELVAAIALERKSEAQMYKAITGRDFEGEHGIRLSLLRRGNKFEANNHANDAAALRALLAGLFPFPTIVIPAREENERTIDEKVVGDPESVLVRDLDVQEPATSGGRVHAGNLVRLKTTREILKDAYFQREGAPHLVIHPTLELPILTNLNGQPVKQGSIMLNPDFMVRGPGMRTYLIGDEKSFIVRDEAVVDPGKLDSTRRQIAAGILAMRYEMKRIDPRLVTSPEGILVFASPYGLKAHVAKREDLSGEIAQIERAIPHLSATGRKLATLRDAGDHQLAAMAPNLATSLRESCYSKCMLVDHCEKLKENRSVALGTDVERLTAGIDLREIADLARRRHLLSGREAHVLDQMERASRTLGLPFAQFLAEIA